MELYFIGAAATMIYFGLHPNLQQLETNRRIVSTLFLGLFWPVTIPATIFTKNS
jgi:hypothetical protein